MESCSEPGAVGRGAVGDRNEKAIIQFLNCSLNKCAALQEAVRITFCQLLGSGRATTATKYFFAQLIPLGILMCLKRGACLSTFSSQNHGQGITMMSIAKTAGNKLKIRSLQHPVSTCVTVHLHIIFKTSFCSPYSPSTQKLWVESYFLFP